MIACSSIMLRATRRIDPTLVRQFSLGRSKGPLLSNLSALIDAGVLQKDEAQIELASRMSDLQGVMASYVPPPPPPPRPLRPAILDADAYLDSDTSDAALAWRADQKEATLKYEAGVADYKAAIASAFAATPRGLYIWGDVGTGKSMLMDLFFETCELPDATESGAERPGNSVMADKNPLSAVLANLIPGAQADTKPRKRRVHFHQFMLELHRRIHATKQAQLAAYGRSRTGKIDFRPDRDPLRLVAADLAAEAHLLAFDEFQVTDVADALIMVQVFDELWKRGTVVVATSNRPPKDLYLGGINREYFMPFIGALEARCAAYSLGAASASNDNSGTSKSASTPANDGTASSNSAMRDSSALTTAGGSSRDYRQLAGAEPMPGAYSWPLNGDDEEHMHRLLKCLCSHWSNNNSGEPAPLEVPVMMGRQLKVPAGSLEAGACAFSFEDLCNRELGAADYKAICDHFDTVLLYGVPVLTLNDHNQARRFVTLIDELYEHQLRIVVTAAARPSSLFAQLEQQNQPISGRGTDRPGGPSAQQPATPSALAGPGGGQAGVDAAQSTVVRTGELASVQELEFAFKRASSRLTEMSGRPYHAQHALKWPNAVPLPEDGALEK